MDNLKERIQQIKKKRPIYQELLDFYQKVREEQEKIKASLKIKSILVKKEWKDLLKKEGFPLLQKQDFPLDIEASIHLFQSLCRIAKDANPYMSEKVGKIEETLTREELNLKELFREALKDKNLEQIIEKLGFDKKVFLFLIQNSTKPSIEAGMKHVSKELESETWLKGYLSHLWISPLLKSPWGRSWKEISPLFLLRVSMADRETLLSLSAITMSKNPSTISTQRGKNPIESTSVKNVVTI